MYKRRRSGTNSNLQSSLHMVFPPKFLRNLANAIEWLQPQRVLIFGSAVRNGLGARDIDLLVVAEFFDRFLWQDRTRLLHLPPGPVYDLRLFTATEFEKFYPSSSPIRQNIENHNIDLREWYAQNSEE